MTTEQHLVDAALRAWKSNADLVEQFFHALSDQQLVALPSSAELKGMSAEIDRGLWAVFTAWSPTEWLAKHTAVSDEDFIREPHRNRFSVLLSRNSHSAVHYGQMLLVKPRS